VSELITLSMLTAFSVSIISIFSIKLFVTLLTLLKHSSLSLIVMFQYFGLQCLNIFRSHLKYSTCHYSIFSILFILISCSYKCNFQRLQNSVYIRETKLFSTFFGTVVFKGIMFPINCLFPPFLILIIEPYILFRLNKCFSTTVSGNNVLILL
jgi:hypothetical protein